MNRQKHFESHRRRGTITHEATMAIVLATAAIVGTAQILAVVSHQHRDLDRRSMATREAGNLMEEIAAKPWNEVTQDSLASLALSDECQSILREPRLMIEVAEEAERDGKQISVEIDWFSSQEQRVEPLRLVAWRYPTGES